MRIGVMTTSYPEEPGDLAGDFVREHCEFHQRRGDLVDVVHLQRKPGPRQRTWPTDDDTQGQLHVHPAKFGPEMLVKRLRFGMPEAIEADPIAWLTVPLSVGALGLSAIRNLRHADALVAHWLLPSALNLALLFPNKPLVAIAHSGDVHLLAKLRLTELFAKLMLRRSARHAPIDLLFVSASLRERFASGGKSAYHLAANARVVAMGAKDTTPITADERKAARSRLLPGIPNDRLTIAVISRLVPIKGLDSLIHAAAQANVSLLIAGDGPERARLTSLATQLGVHAKFVGVVAPASAAKRELFAAADWLFSASLKLPNGRTEGAPVVIAEAFAHGIPVIASESFATSETVGGGALLLHAAELNAEGLTARLRWLGENPGETERYRQVATALGRTRMWSHVGCIIASRLLQSGHNRRYIAPRHCDGVAGDDSENALANSLIEPATRSGSSVFGDPAVFR